MLVRGWKGHICPEIVLLKIDDWCVFGTDYCYVRKEIILITAGGFACSYGSLWGFPPLCDARVRIGNIPFLQCYISYHYHHHHHVILSSLLLLSSHRERFHKKKENIYLDSWYTHTHTRARTHIHMKGRGEITECQRGPHNRYWTHYRTLLEL
jgi:hypothetical protein